MKLLFNHNQPYQQNAVRAITDIEFSLNTAGGIFSENGFGNKLSASEEQILKNVQAIQERNGIENKTPNLHRMNFSVEMETGTGKTYVYLRAIYELNTICATLL